MNEVINLKIPAASTFQSCPGHAVQFYRNTEFLVRAVSSELSLGFGKSEAVVVIAASEQLTRFSRQLTLAGFPVDIHLQSGQLIFLDAAETLSQFMVHGLPDRKLFQEVIGARIAELSNRYSGIRAYGEMVDLLRAQGNFEGVIELENLWNELTRTHSFQLICGYQLNGFASETSESLFDSVCDSHSRVFPAEDSVEIVDEELRNRSIAVLQRRAAALEAEIRERQKIEIALRTNERHLQEAIRLREDFLTVAAHEFKTPITSLLLQNQMHLRRLHKKDPAAQDSKLLERVLNSTVSQAIRLNRLVDDILEDSRMTQGVLSLVPERIELNGLIRQTLDSFSVDFRDVPVRLELKGSVEGLWDRGGLEQVLFHLLRNVVKYAPRCAVEISTSTFIPFGSAGKKWVLMKVRDHGAGIASENLERIFERFERAVPAFHISGLGLGLYLCRKIVQAHGGRIWAESAPEQGTTFMIELPLFSDLSRLAKKAV